VMLLYPTRTSTVLRPARTGPRYSSLIHSVLARILPVDLNASGMEIRFSALAWFSIDAGTRVSETVAVRLRDIDWDARTVHIVDAKDGERRIIPLDDVTCAILRYYVDHVRPATGCKEDYLFLNRDGTPLKAERASKELKRWGQKREVENATAHRFRASCAVYHLANGGDAFVLKDKLGHSYLDMTYRYGQEAKNLNWLARTRQQSPASWLAQRLQQQGMIPQEWDNTSEKPLLGVSEEQERQMIPLNSNAASAICEVDRVLKDPLPAGAGFAVQGGNGSSSGLMSLVRLGFLYLAENFATLAPADQQQLLEIAERAFRSEAKLA
jgi:hypothetical protein